MTVAPELMISQEPQTVAGFTLGWALKRAVLGLLIMMIGCGSVAWLLYASIEPDRADAAVLASQSSVEPATQPKPR